jgi:hypothetical protein
LQRVPAAGPAREAAALLEDREGRVWVGWGSEVELWEDVRPGSLPLRVGRSVDGELQPVAVPEGLTVGPCQALFQDRQGRVWLGGSRGGARLAKRGAPESPEDGATLVYCLESQPAVVCDRLRVRLAGPGIPGRDGIAPEMDGIPIEEFQALMAVNADYPLGVDAFFVRPSGEVMGLPRSTRILVR